MLDNISSCKIPLILPCHANYYKRTWHCSSSFIDKGWSSIQEPTRHKNLSMSCISHLHKLVKETLAGKNPAVLEVLAEHISRVWSMMGNHACEVLDMWHRESALLCCVFGPLEFVLASDQKTALAGLGFYGDWCKWHKEANSMYSLSSGT